MTGNDAEESHRDHIMKNRVNHGKRINLYSLDNEYPLKVLNTGVQWSDLCLRKIILTTRNKKSCLEAVAVVPTKDDGGVNQDRKELE